MPSLIPRRSRWLTALHQKKRKPTHIVVVWNPVDAVRMKEVFSGFRHSRSCSAAATLEIGCHGSPSRWAPFCPPQMAHPDTGYC